MESYPAPQDERNRPLQICLGLLGFAALLVLAWPFLRAARGPVSWDRAMWTGRLLLPLGFVLLGVAGTVFTSSLVAAAFAHAHWRARGVIGATVLALGLIFGQITLVPAIALMERLGWHNHWGSLWCSGFFLSALGTLLIAQMLRRVPRDLHDAARLDGCGFWRIYWHIVLPLARPTLAMVALLTFAGFWMQLAF